VPDKLTVWGLPAELCEILSAAVRAPMAEGVNIKAIVQLAPAATELPQVSASAKSLASVPVKARLVIFKVALPVLVRVTVCAPLVVPTVWLENVKPAGAKLTAGAAATPVPVKVTVFGLSLTLSEMLRIPLRVPVVVGVKTTLTVQFIPAATLVPQLFV
jgi:hypothetical protein